MRLHWSILVLILLLQATILDAQALEFGEPEILFKSDRWEAVNPKWSPDGEHIAFSTPQYKGLYLISRDAEFQEVIQLTEEAAAGYGYQWSPGGQYIAARVARFDQAHRLDALQFYEISNQRRYNITGFVKDAPGLPQWMGNIDTIGYFKKDEMHLLQSGLRNNSVHADTSLRKVFLNDNKIIITNRKGDILYRLNPVQNARYHRAILSPDYKKLAFQAGGKIHLIDIDGTNHKQIDRGSAPSWSPDSKYLAYEVSKDDGHQYISADIFVYHLPTGKQFSITGRFNPLAVQPDWSPIGNCIIFTTLNGGTIYSIDVTK